MASRDQHVEATPGTPLQAIKKQVPLHDRPDDLTDGDKPAPGGSHARRT
jgi:hypothetical protein